MSQPAWLCPQACIQIMVTSLLPNPVASQPAHKLANPLASEFRLLGLRPREARLEVIRGALRETVSDVKSGEALAPVDSGQVARVAVAGYRLLDPRRRGTLFERVQLLLWSEDEQEASPTALWDVAPQPPQPVVATAVGNPLPPPVTLRPSELATDVLTSNPPASSALARTEETQAALEVFRSLRKRDRRATALWVSVTALALSLLLTVSLVVALVN